MANELVPYWFPGDTLPAIAGSGGVTGKRFVAPTGALSVGLGTAGGFTTVLPCGANAKPLGVAAFDAVAGAPVTVFCEGVVPVKCAADLTAGQEVMSDATGQAIVWDGVVGHRPHGVCIGDTSNGSDAPIALP